MIPCIKGLIALFSSLYSSLVEESAPPFDYRSGPFAGIFLVSRPGLEPGT
jgi:hypothetical protein